MARNMHQMRKCRYLIGIDEVGRGPLAGPVTVGAFCIDTHKISVKKLVALLNIQLKKKMNKYAPVTVFDSKSISVEARNIISQSIVADMCDREQGMYMSIKSKTARQIDTKGIAVCIRTLTAEVIADICSQIECDSDGTDNVEIATEIAIFLDGGLKAPAQYPYQETIIKGDIQKPLIGIASILAKVQRDAYMKKVAKKYPVYGFEVHKGYGTKQHINAIKKYGISVLHRKSFLKNIHKTKVCL